ncbi:MAG: serine protease [Proteobacteria bacterium]|nr:serine protease [Pseudomonadota bacterium]
MKGTSMTRGNQSKISVGLTLVAATAIVAACGTGLSDRAVRSIEGPNGKITYVSSYNSPEVIEKIIGSNELTPVLNDGANIPEKYRPIIDAFGKISMGCTATHIGNGLVITAGHCFEAPEKRINNKPCDGITVDWGYRKDKAPYLRSKCTMVLAAELNDDRDYAIFRVDVAPKSSIELDLSARPKTGTTLTIFGHPQLRPLEWSQTCTLENGSNGNWGKDEFSHQCDTEPGNSGSVVLDDQSLKIIGIHDGGRVPWNYATYLLDTPVREFLNDGGSVPPTDPNPAPLPPDLPSDTITQLPTRSYGPFLNNEVRTLAQFGTELGHAISFNMDVNTERNSDFVRILDGAGRTSFYSGKQTHSLEKLPLPVRVTFRSDESIRSKKVVLRQVVAFK